MLRPLYLSVLTLAGIRTANSILPTATVAVANTGSVPPPHTTTGTISGTAAAKAPAATLLDEVHPHQIHTSHVDSTISVLEGQGAPAAVNRIASGRRSQLSGDALSAAHVPFRYSDTDIPKVDDTAAASTDDADEQTHPISHADAVSPHGAGAAVDCLVLQAARAVSVGETCWTDVDSEPDYFPAEDGPEYDLDAMMGDTIETTAAAESCSEFDIDTLLDKPCVRKTSVTCQESEGEVGGIAATATASSECDGVDTSVLSVITVTGDDGEEVAQLGGHEEKVIVEGVPTPGGGCDDARLAGSSDETLSLEPRGTDPDPVASLAEPLPIVATSTGSIAECPSADSASAHCLSLGSESVGRVLQAAGRALFLAADSVEASMTYLADLQATEFKGVPLCVVIYKLERLLLHELLKGNSGAEQCN